MGIARTDVKWELANDNEESLPKLVEPRDAAKTAFLRAELQVNGRPAGGARREGSNMTTVELDLSKIESISKRLEVDMNSPRTASCADRADSTA
jgi:hypothetical protein